MVVATSISATGETAESIQVELSLETREFGLSKVDRHDQRDELLGSVYHKAPSMSLPRDNVTVTISLYGTEHEVEFFGERLSDSTTRTSSLFRIFLVLLHLHHIPRAWMIFGVIVIVMSDGALHLVVLIFRHGWHVALGNKQVDHGTVRIVRPNHCVCLCCSRFQVVVEGETFKSSELGS